jgi:hypothetical protein
MTLFISFALLCPPFPGHVCAYIDPGTGSFVLQVVVAALLTGGYAIRHWAKRLFGRLFSRRDRGRQR